jgi:23S rRNA A1618 N6-methylase RlmF
MQWQRYFCRQGWMRFISYVSVSARDFRRNMLWM